MNIENHFSKQKISMLKVVVAHTQQNKWHNLQVNIVGINGFNREKENY